MTIEEKQFAKYEELPPELKTIIGKNFLSSQTLSNLILTSTANYRLFQPIMNARKLLYLLVHGQLTQARIMLQKDRTLLLKKENVTDYAGRTFYNISALQYALWALDKHMWTMLLDCLLPDEQDQIIRKCLFEQYLSLEQNYIIYEQDGKLIREKHYDFSFIDELEKHVNYFDRPINEIDNWDEMKVQWQTGVGAAQLKVPMYIVFEYCSETPFDSASDFQEQPPEEQKYFDPKEFEYNNWFNKDPKDNQIGNKYAVIKGADSKAVLYEGPSAISWKFLDIDLNAMKKLRQVRIKEFEQLKEELMENLFPTISISAI